MPLLNYTTSISADKTASEIVATLARHGATNIMMDYDQGSVVGIAWRIDREPKPIMFRLPVNILAVYNVLTRQGVMKVDASKRRKQAERTGWRILKDWVEAQMALLETEMVQLEEIFLPYMLTGDRTLYQVLADDGFAKLPAAPNAR